MPVIFTFSTNISSPISNGKLPPWLKKPLTDPDSGNGALRSSLTVPLLSVSASIIWTPFEFVTGKILISSDNPLSFVTISTVSTDVPLNVVLASIFGLPTTNTLGGLV